MSAILEEPLTLEVVFAEPGTVVDGDMLQRNHYEVLATNRAATETRSEDLAAFLDLLYAADADYMDTADYAPAPAPVQSMVDWESVSQALSESQQILIGVQNLLAETMAAMGVEDSQYIRVYADLNGDLRLTSDHPRRDEIEAVLNNDDNVGLRTLYHSAISGMSLAGGLVGTVSAPDELLARAKDSTPAA